MSSPDFRTFVGTLVPSHSAWLAAHASPTGTEFLDHYVGDALHPNGLLWQYEQWRTEHAFTRVRPWNGAEALGRPTSVDIPSPGRVEPWLAASAPPAPEPAGPSFGDPYLAETITQAALQSHFASEGALGAAINAHFNSVRTFNGDTELDPLDTALYSLRLWGFLKWASGLRRRYLGIPVFAIPIAYDADGVPLSDMEFTDYVNRWHSLWHGGAATCTAVTSQQTNNPFAPSASPFAQFCSRMSLPGEFLRFHRDVLDTYDDWRRRNGMPKVARWRPDLHFHSDSINGNAVPEVDLSSDEATELSQIKDRVQHYNSLPDLAAFAEGALHGAGHGAPETEDIASPANNNYSPRFFAWHRWIDYLWEVRQPRFDALRPVLSDGTTYRGVLTVVRPAAPAPDLVQPNNALTSPTAEGRGSLWVRFRVRPESWGRPINLEITAQVFRNSSDLTPEASLAATPVTINAVSQGVDSAATEIQFAGLDADGEGAFAQQAVPGGGVGFKNGRVRITGRLVPVGTIPTSFASGTDQFDHEQHIDLVLVKEQMPPQVSVLLNKSAFSLDEVVVNAGGAAQSPFAKACFLVLQDPPAPPPALAPTSIFADPARAAVAGIFSDGSVNPTVEVVNDAGTATVDWLSVAPTDTYKEQPSLPDDVSQRVLFEYLVLADVAKITAALPNPGDEVYTRLRVTARDRSGNTVQNVLGPRIKLFRAANPYMIDVRDENPPWLSIDTRVFSVRANESKFGHSVTGSGNPNQYIKDVIDAFNAGTQDFESIESTPLELAPTVDGTNVYNFALARVRMRALSTVNDVRAFFRLFTTALSNLSFTAINYPTGNGGAPIALLGRTAGNEIVSIPFFARPRKETRAGQPGAGAMTTQADDWNVQNFAASVGTGESIRYYGAYLDINSDAARYPSAPVGDGPWPAGECVSIRNILRGQHECMAAEIFFPPDPTEPNTTPGTSDNLAQRNLHIVETVNPGLEPSHTVQHSFDFVFPNRRERHNAREELRRHWAAAVSERERDAKKKIGRAPTLTELVATAGHDELVFFWNNLPRESRVEVFLAAIDVEAIVALRNRRRAPQTIRVLEDHRLLLAVDGITYLPMPSVGLERMAGLITITLPDTIKAGQTFTVDVVQTRAAGGIVVGGFQLRIPVGKAMAVFPRESRVLDVFEERLALTPPENRWHPIVAAQVEYLRRKVRALAEEALDECADGDKRTAGRVVIEKIRVLDPFGPLVHGSERLQLRTEVSSAGPEPTAQTTLLPAAGSYAIEGEGAVIEIGKEIFRGPLAGELTIEIWGHDDTDSAQCHFRRAFKGEPESWLGEYGPSDEARDPENVGDWQLWYRIEGL